jgi:hypothetical protein
MVLGSVGLVKASFSLLFIPIDFLTPVAALLCFAAAYASEKAEGKRSVMTLALWGAGIACLLTLLPLIGLTIDLYVFRVNGLMLIAGFVCLLIAYMKSR